MFKNVENPLSVIALEYGLILFGIGCSRLFLQELSLYYFMPLYFFPLRHLLNRSSIAIKNKFLLSIALCITGIMLMQCRLDKRNMQTIFGDDQSSKEQGEEIIGDTPAQISQELSKQSNPTGTGHSPVKGAQREPDPKGHDLPKVQGPKR